MVEINQFLNLDGIPSKTPRGDGSTYFSFDPQGTWQISKRSKRYDIEDLRLRLHDAFEFHIMENVGYSKLIYHVPQFVSLSGHNSESNLTKELFEVSDFMTTVETLRNHQILHSATVRMWARNRYVIWIFPVRNYSIDCPACRVIIQVKF